MCGLFRKALWAWPPCCIFWPINQHFMLRQERLFATQSSQPALQKLTALPEDKLYSFSTHRTYKASSPTSHHHYPLQSCTHIHMQPSVGWLPWRPARSAALKALGITAIYLTLVLWFCGGQLSPDTGALCLCLFLSHSKAQQVGAPRYPFLLWSHYI